jgi:hypothetical protein
MSHRNPNKWWTQYAGAVDRIADDGIPVKHSIELPSADEVKTWASEHPIATAGIGIVGVLALRKLF